jgi:acetyl esterase/lipase
MIVRVAGGLASVAVSVSRRAAGTTMSEQAGRGGTGRLTADSTIQDLLNHPAFAGVGRLLLPWDDREYDPGMRLRDIGALLPYHSHVDPDTVVDGLNRLIADAGQGRQVFYDVYTEGDKRTEPAKAKTGLFLLRGTPGAPFAVIAPGGGFSYVGSVHEGFPYAAAISTRGYNAFVLKYRVGAGGGAATRDLAVAVSYIFRNAKALGVSTRGYSLWGSSAGARMAASIGSHGVAKFGGGDIPGPSAVVMAYTGHSDYSRKEPPTFVVVGERDGIASPSVMETRVEALRTLGADVEFHRFRDVGHGFGPGVGTSAEGWLDRAIRFWERSVR